VVRGAEVRGAATLGHLVAALRGHADWPAMPPPPSPRPLPAIPDLTDVRGQALGRRAIEVAAARRHHLLMIGPPGSGKTMLAERLEGLLPPLTSAKALTVARIHSAAGCALPDGELLERPPFRAPHHQASIVSLVGGGSWSLRPGEVSLATSRVGECTQTAPGGLALSRVAGTDLSENRRRDPSIGAREAPVAQSGRTLTAASRRYGPWVQTPGKFEGSLGGRRRRISKLPNPHCARRGSKLLRLSSSLVLRWPLPNAPRGSRPRETPNAMEGQRKAADSRDWRSRLESVRNQACESPYLVTVPDAVMSP
jgi:energy-coupling factor transporter ATP-binding protein EcfA2